MEYLFAGVAIGCVLLSAGFYAGWRYRDTVGQANGEPSVAVEHRGGSVVLEDWQQGGDD